MNSNVDIIFKLDIMYMYFKSLQIPHVSLLYYPDLFQLLLCSECILIVANVLTISTFELIHHPCMYTGKTFSESLQYI